MGIELSSKEILKAGTNNCPKQKILEFPDNRLMIDLCGQLDANISKIENEINVVIVRTGNRLEISGREDSCKYASAVLQSLYSSLEMGTNLEPGDIDSAIRMPNGLFKPVNETSSTEEIHQENFRSEIKPVEIKTRKKLIKPRTPAQQLYLEKLLVSNIVFGVGPAGTGKTYLAIAVGVSMYLNGSVDKIILTRPAVEAGERLGFLPGDMKEKVDPYMQPLYDSLSDCLLEKQVSKMLDEKIIEIAPLAFMRGRTLSNSFVVLDEAQNATPMQMKMFLTRLGEGSKMAITGDPSQVDLPKGMRSGLTEALKILNGVSGISFLRFNSDDVVRHKLVTNIVKAYEIFHLSEKKNEEKVEKRKQTIGLEG